MNVRRFLYVAAAAVITLAGGTVTALSAATPAQAGTQYVCDYDLSNTLCLYSNGTSGNFVYARSGTAKDFETTTSGYYVCGSNGDKVGGTCPFQAGSGLNSKFAGDTIFTMEHHQSSLYFLGRGSSLDVVQGEVGTGVEWVAVPTSYTNIWYVVSVAASNNRDAPEYLCADGANNPVILSSTFLGSGTCEWSIPSFLWSTSAGSARPERIICAGAVRLGDGRIASYAESPRARRLIALSNAHVPPAVRTSWVACSMVAGRLHPYRYAGIRIAWSLSVRKYSEIA